MARRKGQTISADLKVKIVLETISGGASKWNSTNKIYIRCVTDKK